MRKLLVTILSLSIYLALVPVSAQQSTISYKSTELAPGLHMIEGQGGFAGGNVGLLTGTDGVVLIDDGLPPLAELLLATIRKLTDKPVDFVINTHVHGDHIGANGPLGKAGATIVAHDKLRERLVAEGMPGPQGMAPAPKDALPVLTFSDAVTFHLNGNEAFVFHLERAHTDGDAAILFREANVLHAGDVMFNKLFPFIDLDSGGSVEGYIAAQKKMLSMTDSRTRIIPGHGPLANAADLMASIEMLETSLASVRALVEAGKSEDEILAAEPLAAFEAWSWQFIDTERMTRTLIRSLRRDP
jgi:glyoxylase-like metal-dependent hydrolase (beta-lactamase superfamily II)